MDRGRTLPRSPMTNDSGPGIDGRGNNRQEIRSLNNPEVVDEPVYRPPLKRYRRGDPPIYRPTPYGLLLQRFLIEDQDDASIAERFARLPNLSGLNSSQGGISDDMHVFQSASQSDDANLGEVQFSAHASSSMTNGVRGNPSPSQPGQSTRVRTRSPRPGATGPRGSAQSPGGRQRGA